MPRSGAGRQALPGGRRDVAVVVQAAAHVEDGLGADHARPGHRAAVAGVGAGPGEAAVGRTAVLAEGARVEDDRPHEAEPVRHLVLVAQRVSSPWRRSRRWSSRAAPPARSWSGRGCAGGVRLGDQRQQPARDRADALLRNLVVLEPRPAVAVDVAGERIVDAVRHRAEIAIAHRHRRNRRAHDVAAVVERPLVVAEEEQLVLDDRSAQREAAVEELVGALRCVK